MILVGGVLGAAAALALGRGDLGKVKLGYYSLLFVGFPGLVLTKIGATAIWSKESPHSLIGAAFPHTDDPRWIMVGGTALDGGAGSSSSRSYWAGLAFAGWRAVTATS